MKRLDEILQRCEAATPGPWTKGCLQQSHEVIDSYGSFLAKYNATGPTIEVDRDAGYEQVAKDAEFISHARQDLPLVTQALQLAIGRLEGFANSALYDHETKWAKDVLADITAILEGE